MYTQDEVEKMISVIDRNSPQGKRDYAMVLLAARYGLRISDIMGMRFCNLDWEQNKISLIQKKTARKVVLPLSKEVGRAIIEYIKYGRPAIDSPFVFLTAHAPYKELGSNILRSLIAEYMRVAGINSKGRKKGFHSLRHSLATNLLNGCDRVVPMSLSLTAVCKDYVAYKISQGTSTKPDSTFFTSPDGRSCQVGTVHENFRGILTRAGIPYGGRSKGPRLHDLLHTLCVNALLKMANAGYDLYYTMPVLMTYMGHKSLEATNKYVRLTEEMYPNILKKVSEAYKYVFPEIGADLNEWEDSV